MPPIAGLEPASPNLARGLPFACRGLHRPRPWRTDPGERRAPIHTMRGGPGHAGGPTSRPTVAGHTLMLLVAVQVRLGTMVLPRCGRHM